VRLFLDANVLFTAAHNPVGRSAALFALAQLDACVLVTSPHGVEEARRNLALKYPDRAPVLDDLLRTVLIVPEAPAPVAAWAARQGLPAGDAPILAAAVQAAADVLVTGDRTHFGALFRHTLRGVTILDPADALARLLSP
jgi:predicted nucleic acid-binding protein